MFNGRGLLKLLWWRYTDLGRIWFLVYPGLPGLADPGPRTVGTIILQLIPACTIAHDTLSHKGRSIWVGIFKGWEFAHLFSERIARFLPKSERMSDSLKSERFAHPLIFGELPERFAQVCSFPLSDLSESLTVAHFWWATWANRSWLLSFGERPERFAHIAQREWATVSELLRLLTKYEWMSKLLMFFGEKWVIRSENWWALSQLSWDSVSPFPPENLFSEITYNWRRNPYRTMCYFIIFIIGKVLLTFKLKQTFFLNN